MLCSPKLSWILRACGNGLPIPCIAASARRCTSAGWLALADDAVCEPAGVDARPPVLSALGEDLGRAFAVFCGVRLCDWCLDTGEARCVCLTGVVDTVA